MRKQFVFQLLYRRMFSHDDGAWIVLGGNALFVRTGGGRFTKDVDLSRADELSSTEEVGSDLERLLSRDVGDGFTFRVNRVAEHDHRDRYGYGTQTMEARVVVLLGGLQFDTFTMDLSHRRHVSGPIERVRPTPIIEDEALTELPWVPVYPTENHTADKVCALYERHPNQKEPWSTRYRDLADLVRIVEDLPLDADRLASVLEHERKRRRLPHLPKRLESPHETWKTEYPRQAKTFSGFPSDLYPLDASLERAGRCLNPILSGERTSGTWNPEDDRWDDT